MKYNEPLGMPDGSVRAILTLLIVSAALAGFFLTDKLDFQGLMALCGIPLTFYFSQYTTAPGAANGTRLVEEGEVPDVP